MRNKISSILLFFTIAMNSQISDIANLTSGSLEFFTPILELDESIYGYFSVYKLEEVSKTEEKYEYVLLDKNLNKVANGEFIDLKYKELKSKFYYPEKIDDKLILSKLYYYPGAGTLVRPNPEKLSFVTHRTIDLTSNKVFSSFHYKNGDFIDGARPVKGISKIARSEKTIDYPLAFSEGFFMFERIKNFSKIKDLKNMTSLKAYGLDKKMLWKYDYNLENKKTFYKFKLLNDKSIVFWTKEDKTKSVKLHGLNPKTGDALFVYELENTSSDFSHKYIIKEIGEKITIVGSYSKYKAYSGYDSEKSLGFFRIELDKKGNELSKKYISWIDLNSHIEIKKNGKLKKGFKLATREFFTFSDHTVSILTKKWKSKESSDYVVLNFDKDFNVKGINIIEEEKGNKKYLGTRYLFSQKRKEEGKVTFFYKKRYKQPSAFAAYGVLFGGKKALEKIKKKITPDKLVIVTLIDGKVNEEEIAISNSYIYPLMAKEGFILLREVNTQEDYDQIRLEKLNN